jgi:hypothetical protein
MREPCLELVLYSTTLLVSKLGSIVWLLPSLVIFTYSKSKTSAFFRQELSLCIYMAYFTTLDPRLYSVELVKKSSKRSGGGLIEEVSDIFPEGLNKIATNFNPLRGRFSLDSNRALFEYK